MLGLVLEGCMEGETEMRGMERWRRRERERRERKGNGRDGKWCKRIGGGRRKEEKRTCLEDINLLLVMVNLTLRQRC